jgi:diguanylate cyclase (GGDEF) domain
MLDIDFFKQVNDRFSHQVGDEVLRELAEILRSESRSNDIIGRYGGEEFVIILPETPLLKAVAACEKMRLIIQAHDWRKIHPDLSITVSIGVVELTSQENIDQLLSAADKKLYEAKRTGRNRVCF